MKAEGAFVAKKVKGVSLRLIVVIILFVLALAAFYTISDEAVLENETGFDKLVFRALAPYTSPSVTHIMTLITFFGSTYFLLPAYLILCVYYLTLRRNSQISLNISAIGITSTAVLFGVKSIFHRHRPLDPLIQKVGGFSFPSGHSFSSFTFFGLLIYIVWKTNIRKRYKWMISIFLFAFAASIAVSRVYLHVHFATDVIAGFCLCIIWLTISFAILNRVNFNKAGTVEN